jgi:membrane protein involved in colicin uptake
MSKRSKRARTILKRMSILGEIPSPELARRYGIHKEVQIEINRREAIRLAEAEEKRKAEEAKRKAEEDAKRKAEEAKKKAEAAKKRKAAAKKKAEAKKQSPKE